MRQIVNAVFVAAVCLTAGPSFAVEVVGDALFYDPTNFIIGGPEPVIGTLDEAGGTMSLSSFNFFGMQFIAATIEVLGEGIHTRDAGTVTVGPGQLGASVSYNWGATMGIPGFLVWDIVPHPGGRAFVPVDSDGDGVPGHAFISGPFPGFTVVYDLHEGTPPPAVDLTLSVAGGTRQECAETGGTSVTVAAMVAVIGQNELSEVRWTVDGVNAGTGMSITPFLTVGSHTVEATALPTVGISDTEQVTITIADTTPPEVAAAFVDPRTGEVVDAAARGRVAVSYSASDICDPEPAVEAVAVPVYAVADGQILRIGGEHNQVLLPASAINLTVTATDAAGNTISRGAVLHIVD